MRYLERFVCTQCCPKQFFYLGFPVKSKYLASITLTIFQFVLSKENYELTISITHLVIVLLEG